MAVFSFLFGGSSASSNGGNSSKPRSANNYPTSSSSPAYPPSTSQHGAADGEYDDVALGGSGADGAYPPSRPSFSAPAATAGSFVGGGGGGGGYSVEASYPPLPSFSRPSGSLSHASSSSISSGGGGGGKYPSLPSTFARLEALLSTHSPLLLDSLSPPLPYGRRDEALLSLQAAIAPYTLPPAVIDSYLCHDGQDSLSFTGAGGKGDVGLVYGLWWLPLERVEEEWRFWRRLESAGGLIGPGVGGDAFSASSSSSASTRGVGGRAHPYRPEERAEQGRAQGEAEEGDLEGMSAFPPGWIRARYSHPGWLPLLTDRCGNYIGVDLDPPPPSPSPASPTSTSFPQSHSRTNSSSLNNHGYGVTPQKAYGQPGQVIAFGREIDEKVVLFPGDGPGGWARFLASFVEDVERGEVARLGEGSATASRWGDEESGRGGGSGSSGEDGEGEGEGAWGEAGDGLGERGYFESAGVYGDEAEEGGRGRKVGGQTWILRAPYRRMAAQLSLLSDGGGGIIGLLAERSRRKWRSLGVGTRIVAPNGVNGVGREPLKVVVPNGVSAEGGEEQPGSAATMKPGVFSGEQEKPQVEGQENQPPSSRTASPHPLAPLDTTAASADASSSSSNVELTFSPPSPTATFNNGPPLPPPSSSSSSRRTSHESSRSRTSSHDGSQYLQQPPRRSSGSQQPRQRQPRRPPPPPAPVGLPTFSELDFSDAIADPSASSTAEYGGRGVVPIPTATWLLNDGADRPSPLQQQQQNSGGLMSRLSSFGSSGPTPTRESILPTSRPSSVAAVSPPPASPRLSSSSSRSDHHSIPMHHSRDPSTEDGTDDVPLRVPDERSRSTAALVGGESPPVSPLEGEGREATLEVVVKGEEGAGIKRTASPADQPYEGEGR